MDKQSINKKRPGSNESDFSQEYAEYNTPAAEYTYELGELAGMFAHAIGCALDDKRAGEVISLGDTFRAVWPPNKTAAERKRLQTVAYALLDFLPLADVSDRDRKAPPSQKPRLRTKDEVDAELRDMGIPVTDLTRDLAMTAEILNRLDPEKRELAVGLLEMASKRSGVKDTPAKDEMPFYDQGQALRELAMICTMASYYLDIPAARDSNKLAAMTVELAAEMGLEDLPAYEFGRGADHLLEVLKPLTRAFNKAEQDAQEHHKQEWETRSSAPSKPSSPGLGLIEVPELEDDDLLDPHHAICLVIQTLLEADQSLREGWYDDDHQIQRPVSLQEAIENALHQTPESLYNRTMGRAPFKLVLDAFSSSVARYLAARPSVRNRTVDEKEIDDVLGIEGAKPSTSKASAKPDALEMEGVEPPSTGSEPSKPAGTSKRATLPAAHQTTRVPGSKAVNSAPSTV